MILIWCPWSWIGEHISIFKKSIYICIPRPHFELFFQHQIWILSKLGNEAKMLSLIFAFLYSQSYLMDSSWIKQSFWACFLTSHYWTLCGVCRLLSHFHQPENLPMHANPVSFATVGSSVHSIQSSIYLSVVFFFKYRPRDTTGYWEYKLDTYLSSLSLWPIGGGRCWDMCCPGGILEC